MRYVWLFMLMIFPLSMAFGQESKLYKACSRNARTQSAMNVCASEEAQRVEAELERVYQELLAKAGADQRALSKIRLAQDAWKAYRNAYIDAMYPAEDKQTEYGSAYPLEIELLRARMARQQVQALKILVRRYSN